MGTFEVSYFKKTKLKTTLHCDLSINRQCPAAGADLEGMPTLRKCSLAGGIAHWGRVFELYNLAVFCLFCISCALREKLRYTPSCLSAFHTVVDCASSNCKPK